MNHTKFPRCVSLSITFNDHALNYQSVAQWVSEAEELAWFEWVSPDERQRAIEHDSVWTCRWYPDTPVGFCALAASTFEALMTAVNEAQS